MLERCAVPKQKATTDPDARQAGGTGKNPVLTELYLQIARETAKAMKAVDKATKGAPEHIVTALRSFVTDVARQTEQYIQLDLIGGKGTVGDSPIERAPDFSTWAGRGQYPWGYGTLAQVVYQTDKISWKKYNDMLQDPQVDFCLTTLKARIKDARWSFQCADPEIAKWANEDFGNAWPSFCRGILMALNYGWSPCEIVWERDARTGRVGVASFNDLDPTYAYIVQDRTGALLGVEQRYGGLATFIPEDKLAFYSFRQQAGALYGRGLLRAAYPYWWCKRFVVQFMQVWAERFAIPWFLVRYPERLVMTGVDANKVPTWAAGSTVATQKANQIRGQSSIALPSSQRDGHYEWDIETRTTGASSSGTHPYSSMLDFCDAQIAKAIMTPSLTVEMPERGSQSLGKSQANRTGDVAGDIGEDLGEIVEPIYNRARIWNFGADSPPLNWVLEPVQDDLKAQLWPLAAEMVKAGKFVAVGTGGQALVPDIGKIAEDLGIPLRAETPEESERRGRMAELAERGIAALRGGEKDRETEDKDKPKESSKASFEVGQEFRRALTRHEKADGMRALKATFGFGEETARTVAAPILAKQKGDVDGQVERIWKIPDKAKRLEKVESIQVKHKAEMEAAIEALLKDLIGRTSAIQSEEYGVAPEGGKSGTDAWASATARNLAEDEARGIRVAAMQVAATAAVQEVSDREAFYRVRKAMDDRGETFIAGPLAMAVAQAINLATQEGLSEDPRFAFAQWSALLDNVTCPLCQRRDGQVISTANPEFKSWSPPIHFGPCRCVWVPVKGTDVEETWEDILPAALMKHYQLA